MQLALIESDIIKREEALKRCKANLQYLRNASQAKKNKEVLKLMEQEAFYLKDQLKQFYVLAAILKDEQGPRDEVFKKA